MLNAVYIDGSNSSSDIAYFLRKNLNNVHYVVVESQTLLSCISTMRWFNHDCTDYELDYQIMEMLHEIASSAFSNKFAECNSPFSTPQFFNMLMSELDQYDGISNTWLYLLYAYGIPVFIADLDNINMIFCRPSAYSFDLVSRVSDMDLLQRIFEVNPYEKEYSHSYLGDNMISAYSPLFALKFDQRKIKLIDANTKIQASDEDGVYTYLYDRLYEDGFQEVN